jgi:hypothetical protein
MENLPITAGNLRIMAENRPITAEENHRTMEAGHPITEAAAESLRVEAVEAASHPVVAGNSNSLQDES